MSQCRIEDSSRQPLLILSRYALCSMRSAVIDYGGLYDKKRDLDHYDFPHWANDLVRKKRRGSS